MKKLEKGVPVQLHLRNFYLSESFARLGVGFHRNTGEPREDLALEIYNELAHCDEGRASVLIGDAGMGKSFLCRSLARFWALSSGKEDDDEAIFDAVVYVPLSFRDWPVQPKQTFKAQQSVSLWNWISEAIGATCGEMPPDVESLGKDHGRVLWVFDGLEQAEPAARGFLDEIVSSTKARMSMGICYSLFCSRDPVFPIGMGSSSQQLLQWSVTSLQTKGEKVSILADMAIDNGFHKDASAAALSWISSLHLDELTFSPELLRLLWTEYVKVHASKTTPAYFASDALHAVFMALLTSRIEDPEELEQHWRVLSQLGYQSHCLDQAIGAKVEDAEWLQDCCFLSDKGTKWGCQLMTIFFAAVYISQSPPSSIRGYRQEFPGLLSSLVSGLLRRSAPSPQYDTLCAILSEEDASSFE